MTFPSLVRGSPRYRLTKMLFEHRQRQLQAVRDAGGNPPFTPEHNGAYGFAVERYERARRRWRAARGWN